MVTKVFFTRKKFTLYARKVFAKIKVFAIMTPPTGRHAPRRGQYGTEGPVGRREAGESRRGQWGTRRGQWGTERARGGHGEAGYASGSPAGIAELVARAAARRGPPEPDTPAAARRGTPEPDTPAPALRNGGRRPYPRVWGRGVAGGFCTAGWRSGAQLGVRRAVPSPPERFSGRGEDLARRTPASPSDPLHLKHLHLHP